MNLANRITIARMFLVPICLLLLAFGFKIAAVIVFIIACVTDALDGYVARTKNLITNFGKFMDPLVDKLLVNSVLIMLVELRNLSCWVVIIIIWRELIVTGFRLAAVKNDVVISASKWGKLKTVSQMIMTAIVMLDSKNFYMVALEFFMIGCSLILTLFSGFDYINKNKSVLYE